MTRSHGIRAASVALLGALALTTLGAPVTQGAGTAATCRVRNATQDTAGRSFASMISATADGDRLTVEGECHASRVRIQTDIVIRGIGDRSRLDADGQGRVLRVGPGAVVILRAIQIAGGHSVNRGGNEAFLGGGILNRGSLTLVDSDVLGNVGDYGGGIYNAGTLTMVNSTMRYNRAGYGAGVANAGIAVLKGSRVVGNVAHNTGGGILSFFDGTLTLSESRVVGNTAVGYGGGIENGGTALLSHTLVRGNSAGVGEGAGGGIYNYGALTLTASIVRENAAGIGGGIDNQDGRAVLTDSVVRDNTASDGGGIRNDARFTMTGSYVRGNRARRGGGIANGGRFTMIGSIVRANLAQYAAGIWMVNPGRLTLRRSSLVTANTAGKAVGGIAAFGGILTLLGGSSVVGNNPDDCFGTDAC